MRQFLLRVGTRGSALSLWRKRRSSGRGSSQIPSLATLDAIETLVIKATGDAARDRSLAAIHTDVAVHSLEDLETFLPQALGLAAHLPREDPRRAFFSPHAPSSRPRQRASCRDLVAAAARAGARCAARQCRDAPQQTRIRRGQCHVAGARWREAARA